MTNKYINTTITPYCFDLTKESEKAQYTAMREELKRVGLKCFTSYPIHERTYYKASIQKLYASKAPVGVRLYTQHVFENQWNAAFIYADGTVTKQDPPAPIPEPDSILTPEQLNDLNREINGDRSNKDPLSQDPELSGGVRLFDWYEGIYTNTNIKKGYYINQSYEMAHLRHRVYKCGYCGHQIESYNPPLFHKGCLGSPFLTLKDLPLTRYRPVVKLPFNQQLENAAQSLLNTVHLEDYNAAQFNRRVKESQAEKQRLIEALPIALKAVEEKTNAALLLLEAGFHPSDYLIYRPQQRTVVKFYADTPAIIKDEWAKKLGGFPYTYEFTRQRR